MGLCDRPRHLCRPCRWATHSEQMLKSVQRLNQAKFQIKAVATKRIIFLVQKSEKGRPRFHSAGPIDVRDGRWSAGARMVAVDVAIAHRGPRDFAGWSRVGVVGDSHLRRSTAPDASQRDTLFPILASMRKPKIARASLSTSAMMHAARSHMPGVTGAR